jgi:nucleoside-diphosphate-sugar epimerase
LAALLSATAEKPCFRLGFKYEFFISRFAKAKKNKKNILAIEYCFFWSNNTKENTPQYTIMEPSTVYGISKQSGERWCEYYHNIFGVDEASVTQDNQLFLLWRWNYGLCCDIY